MSIATEPATDRMVFRKTNAHLGRKITVSPGNSANRHLSYGRVILNRSTPSVSFDNGDQETGLIVLSGEATIRTAGEETRLGQYDAMYIPRDSHVQVSTSSAVDVAEFSAGVENTYPLQVVRFAEISEDPGLRFTTGNQASQRHLHLLLAKNVQAGRLVIGFTYSEPGNWTSWPPHEHTKLLEEMYVFFDMPAPAYAVQLVYNNTECPELVTVVRDGDAVLIPGGFHPNVSVPNHRVCFLWAMAAHREAEDRHYGVVNVQPGFDQGSSGLEKGRAQK